MISKRPIAISLFGYFFIFGALMSGLSTASLLTPGGLLEPMWRVNPTARTAFASMGIAAPLLLLTVCAACAISATGLLRGKYWGYIAGMAMLIINLIGDTVSAATGLKPEAIIGLPIVAVILYFLTRPNILAYYKRA